ncbi:MAG: TolC family protein [Pseudomonadota bacterium]
MTLPPASIRLRFPAALALLTTLAPALAGAALPEPLTLEDALLLAGKEHPALALAHARLAQRVAAADRVAARDAIDVGATLEARVVDPPRSAEDQGHNDSRATIFARKRLYDFGHTRALEAAAATAVASGELRTTAETQDHRIAIMQAFFDVLLADLEFARDNEAMAVAYVQADRSRDRNELGQLSDIALLAQEAEYQEYRMRRSRAQARQRSTRALLAQLLDRPGELPSTLQEPDLTANDRPLPEFDQLIEQLQAANPAILALRADLEAARLQLEAERTGRRPVLSGSVAAAANEREVGSRNPLEAELRLEIPLYDGRRVDAEVAQAQAEMYRLRAELRQLEYDLRQRALELWLDIQTLQAQREQVEVFTRSRALNFDRAQAEYELELKTDFGHALVGQSESALLRAQTEYSLALDWARLAALTGEPWSPWIDTTPASAAGTTPHETTSR